MQTQNRSQGMICSAAQKIRLFSLFHKDENSNKEKLVESGHQWTRVRKLISNQNTAIQDQGQGHKHASPLLKKLF